MGLLDRLKLPEGLRQLSPEQQRLLCWEIRQLLIKTVSKTGGHLASNLGVVELTLALLCIFDPPKDSIIWDVGHQSYAYKLLTGRYEKFSTLRQEGGISGFPRTAESEYDAFIGGHASTSLSAACGLAKANSLQKNGHTVVAVVGDGALTGGMLYEALNNAGRSNDRLVVILNDNEMSISQSVGSFARYLAEVRASNGYLKVKDKVEDTLHKIPVVGEGVRRTLIGAKSAFRQLIYHSNLFEDFGFDYLGPVDGHDLSVLFKVLRHARELEKPVVVHVNTVKGKGYPFAEKNPSKFHGVGSFNRESGEVPGGNKGFSAAFGDYLTAAAEKDSRICAITAAMEDGTGLQRFAAEFGDKGRFFDVGIAEEHALTFACGLAAGGLLPVFAVYSTFLQRCYDQLIHDAAIEPRHIVLAVDRAGVVGDDGETHQGLFDVAMLTNVPGTAIYSPADEGELRWCFGRALYHETGIAAVRYPRGALPEHSRENPADYHLETSGGQVLLISYGREFAQVRRAAELLNVTGKPVDVMKLTKLWPIPRQAILEARRYRAILFCEEGVLCGGLGEHFMEAMAETKYRGIIRVRAIQNPFLPPLKPERALCRCGLDAQSIAEEAERLYF